MTTWIIYTAAAIVLAVLLGRPLLRDLQRASRPRRYFAEVLSDKPDVWFRLSADVSAFHEAIEAASENAARTIAALRQARPYAPRHRRDVEAE